MVARTPPKQKKMVAPLNPTLLRETVNKVDKCMARLQELQYTVTGGTKVISGVSLSPRSTRGYLRTSLRCKQESLRIKSSNPRKSPPGKLPTNAGDWRRMSLPAMLLGETVGEIMQASQFAREIVSVASKMKKLAPSEDPKTPVTIRRKQRPNPENSEIRARRKKEKQITLHTIRLESDAPTFHRARSRINFKVSPPKKREQEKQDNALFLANRVSPRNRPWAKKTVLFPNPLFHSSPTSHHHKFCKTKSPIIARNRQTTPHKFLIKSPSSSSKFQVKIKSPTLSVSPKRPTSLSRKSPKVSSTAAKIRRSFSPSRLANRLVSPLKGRKSVQKSDGGGGVMSGLKQRPTSMPMRFSARRAPF
ncbi:microtubule-binding protein TANGLED [Cornus florida]|uniref:microtubule-binding protein TANGLED n=1 Tax=Cornus florida TaxID=4283 RepID=UPI00289D4065|nr:microtubule-binding protein TANGLED [Cornus florida]